MFPLYLYKMTILVFHSFKNSVFYLFLLIFRNPSCSLRVNSPAIYVTNVFMVHPWLFTPFMVSLSSQKLLHACMLSRFTVSHSLQAYGSQPARLLCPGHSSGTNTGVGCCALLQGNLPDPGLNWGLLCLLHWPAGSILLAPPGKLQKLLVSMLMNVYFPL